MTVTHQLPLDLSHPTSFDLVDFIVSPSNRSAFDLVARWPDWPSHAAALVGPSGCGKSHLAACWLKICSGVSFVAGMAATDVPPGVSVLVEDADILVEGAGGRAAEDEATSLFHLFNWTRETGAHLMLTARSAPTLWRCDLPDLRSRLATIPVTEIGAPDDDLLRMIVTKLFSDRQLQVDPSVIDYILVRMERSFAGARRLVSAMDRRALASRRDLTRALARECLDEDRGDDRAEGRE